MRDGATGRSRGFGFLTFKDPKTVNTVMVKEHFLDGKIVSAASSKNCHSLSLKVFFGARTSTDILLD
jgi:RNA-binding protein Musashi